MGVTDFNSRNPSEFLRIAISAYALVAMIKKRLAAGASRYTNLLALTLNRFEKASLIQLVKNSVVSTAEDDTAIHLNFSIKISGQ